MRALVFYFAIRNRAKFKSGWNSKFNWQQSKILQNKKELFESTLALGQFSQPAQLLHQSLARLLSQSFSAQGPATSPPRPSEACCRGRFWT
jgi:hypothetical protein